MTLPAWLEPLPDSAEQRALDEWAIEDQGIAGIELMERAGAGLAQLTAQKAPQGQLAVVCGKGNNGGDGYVAARVLREQGREVRVLAIAPPEELRGDARTNADRLPGERPEEFSEEALSGAAAVIDAVLGTGFSGEARGNAAEAIDAINDAAATTVACDVPSGVDASTGEVIGAAVKAQATATFNAAKPGLWIAPGKAHSGEVTVVDIGIPPGGPGEPKIGLIGDQVTADVPRRGRESTKFAAGSVLICGGSTGLTGAPCLAAEAGMRAGAGYITACVPASLNQVFEARLLEVMTDPIADSGGSISSDAVPAVLERVARVQSLVLGPGLGRAPDAFDFARALAREAEVPLLLDADGLNAHAGKLDELAKRSAPTVITPHAGELARLLERESGHVAEHRLECARLAAQQAQAIVVLKGDDTLVAAPDGVVAVNKGGAAALATAGSGDVLSGVIAAYLAKQMDPFHAACAGVFVHAQAGRLAAIRIGSEGVIASDVIEALPHALPPAG